MKNILLLTKRELLKKLWDENRHIKKILRGSENLHVARNNFFGYLNDLERHYFNIHSDKHFNKMHILEKNNAKECIRVLKNIIRTENEKLTDFSALEILYSSAKNNARALRNINEGFLCEFIFLFRAICGKSEIPPDTFILHRSENAASIARSQKLDEYARYMAKYFKKYKIGTDGDVLVKRIGLKNKILKYFRADEKKWKNYRWQLKHIIKDSKTLSDLVKLEPDELEGISCAEKNGVPFQITPYYLSLFNQGGRTRFDRAIRAQVLPSSIYCLNVSKNRRQNIDMDFMDEKSTSPVHAVTRRYPQIVILKPFDSCPQICVYCQRNWEVKSIDETKMTQKDVKEALLWIKNNKNITEVLVTGGDPLTLSNKEINSLLRELSKMSHIERIRIGTRVLATLPFRIDGDFIKILEKYHKFGKREICIVTHFEHSFEVTPDFIEAVKKIRMLGISVYNQQVFTYFNSFKYETCALRKALKLAGVDPYYTFNTKGKEETIDYRVPIARIEQERKEEARFLPGVVRTDEPVFNVPKLGKSHLRSWQDHEPIMILADGKRVYRFYPWESGVSLVDDYLYADVSIYDYLKRLFKDKENVNDYKSIWYYF